MQDLPRMLEMLACALGLQLAKETPKLHLVRSIQCKHIIASAHAHTTSASLHLPANK